MVECNIGSLRSSPVAYVSANQKGQVTYQPLHCSRENVINSKQILYRILEGQKC